MFENLKGKFNIDKILFIFAIVIFIGYCLPLSLTHIPYIDELNAWNIARDLNLLEILQLGKYEGHTFIWYFLIMPFAKTNFMYPYSQEILNWLFAFGAILILWKYAPFNSLIKLFITFSSPFRIHSMYARCYAVGFFLIFLICSLYPNRLKHPLWYSLLLILLANTSIMGATIAFGFGIIFCIDLYEGIKNKILLKKDVFGSIFICLSGAVLLLSQLSFFHTPDYSRQYNLKFFLANIWYMIDHLLLILIFLFIISSIIFLRKIFKPLIFLLVSNFVLFCIFSISYHGGLWHYQFFLISYIVTAWLYLLGERLDVSKEKIYMAIFGVYCFLLTITPAPVPEDTYSVFKEYFLQNLSEYENKNIFFIANGQNMRAILPYLKNKNIKFYDRYGNDAHSLESYKHLWFFDEPVNWDNVKNIIGEEEGYIFTTEEDLYAKLYKNVRKTPIIQIKNYKGELKLTPYKYIYPAIIYKVERGKSK